MDRSDIERFQARLYACPDVLRYVTSRGVLPASIKAYGIGYFDATPMSNYYGRVLFPVRDQYGVLRGCQGRDVLGRKDVPKYWHYLPDKGKVLYGLFENGRRLVAKDYALVVEGPFGVIAAAQRGAPAVAAFGTAFTDDQAVLLSRFCDRALLWYDPDKAGRAAQERARQTLTAAGFRKVECVPDGTPEASDLALTDGPHAVSKVLEHGERSLGQ